MKNHYAYVFRNIGRCTFCMRQSFQAAAAACLLSAGLFAFGGEIAGQLAVVVTLCLTLLWLSHLVTYASRNVSMYGTGSATLAPSINVFFESFMFMLRETTAPYRRAPTDRFGRPVDGRAILVEVKNSDGTRTAYFKNADDINALIVELKSRGFSGQALEPEYWMSTNSCERSAGNQCSSHTCDSASQSCRQVGTNMAYCRCM
jgi:hypothetical protein